MKRLTCMLLLSILGTVGLLLTNEESSAVYGEASMELCSNAEEKKTSIQMLDVNPEILTEEKATAQIAPESTTEESTTQTSTESFTEMTTENSNIIDNFPIIFQMPQLPTGCEITAATMVLNYYGFNADKILMAEEYLPTANRNLHYGSDGRLYGSDLNEYFIGNPKTESGYVCGTGAIVTALNRYLTEQGSSLRAIDISGSTPQELYEFVKDDTPVIVWVTIEMNNRNKTQGWYTDSGEYVEWSTNDHGAVLIGYDETAVTIADPISGLIKYDKDRFESVFASRGNKCVIVE